jgi:hypothetical protein
MFQEHTNGLHPEPDESSPHPHITYHRSDHKIIKYLSVVSLCMLHVVTMELFLNLITFLSRNYLQPDVTSSFSGPKVLITVILGPQGEVPWINSFLKVLCFPPAA